MANRTIRTPVKRAAFLYALSETGTIAAAAHEAGLSRRALYDWRNEDPIFAADWEDALEIGLDSLEDEAIRRAREGIEQPIYHQGRQVRSVRKYSDLLLMFLIKHRRPRYQPPAQDTQAEVREIAS